MGRGRASSPPASRPAMTARGPCTPPGPSLAVRPAGTGTGSEAIDSRPPDLGHLGACSVGLGHRGPETIHVSDILFNFMDFL